MHRSLIAALGLLALTRGSTLAQPNDGPPERPEIGSLDLAKAFHARSAWRLVSAHGPATQDYGGNAAPGALTLCVEAARQACRANSILPPARQNDTSSPGWEAHYLLGARPVSPAPGGAPLLLILTGSLNSGDGDQVIATQLFRYDQAADRFVRVFARSTGKNRNEEIRFVERAPLQGDVVSAEPTENAPFGYWIEVRHAGADGVYRRILRYRSATHYDDGNPLPVIDSETPGIEQRLGLWRPGSALPLPDGPCPRPRLVRRELWCGPPSPGPHLNPVAATSQRAGPPPDRG